MHFVHWKFSLNTVFTESINHIPGPNLAISNEIEIFSLHWKVSDIALKNEDDKFWCPRGFTLKIPKSVKCKKTLSETFVEWLYLSKYLHAISLVSGGLLKIEQILRTNYCKTPPLSCETPLATTLQAYK